MGILLIGFFLVFPGARIYRPDDSFSQGKEIDRGLQNIKHRLTKIAGGVGNGQYQDSTYCRLASGLCLQGAAAPYGAIAAQRFNADSGQADGYLQA
jgi:hypothetical protein